MFDFLKKSPTQKELDEIIKHNSTADMLKAIESNGWYIPHDKYRKTSIAAIVKSQRTAKATRRIKKVFYDIDCHKLDTTPKVEWLVFEADDNTNTLQIAFKIYCRQIKSE